MPSHICTMLLPAMSTGIAGHWVSGFSKVVGVSLCRKKKKSQNFHRQADVSQKDQLMVIPSRKEGKASKVSFLLLLPLTAPSPHVSSALWSIFATTCSSFNSSFPLLICIRLRQLLELGEVPGHVLLVCLKGTSTNLEQLGVPP
jgi:hypothetical protein